MAITAKTWIRAVVSTTGAVVGGPTGTIIGTVLGAFLAFHPGGKWLVTAAWEGKLRVWDLSAPDPTASPVIFNDCYEPGAFSPDGKWLASDCFDKKINLWRMSDLAAPPISLDGLGGGNYALSFSSDSHWMAAGGWLVLSGCGI
ncbi:MAG: WD40 repeat domain-containing protein [Planctomycetes bacterium]|nr:WD40 repeat domain-containing protein [Planctomycetota bacterium]